MKIAIICYDLKNVRPYQNIFVKAALAKFANTFTTKTGVNVLSPTLDWIQVTLPDTTLLASVPDGTTSENLIADTLRVISETGAEAERVYVAFIDPTTDLLFNASCKAASGPVKQLQG